VRATAADAARGGFEARILLDLTAGVAPDSTAKAIEDLRTAGVELTGTPSNFSEGHLERSWRKRRRS